MLTQYNMLTGAYFSKYADISSPLITQKHRILEDHFAEEACAMELEATEQDDRASSPQKQVESSIFSNATYEIYRYEESPNIVALYQKHAAAFCKKLREEVTIESYFKSYRYILDIENFAEKRNTLVFWKTYIRQLWEQSNPQEKEKLWLCLNELLIDLSTPGSPRQQQQRLHLPPRNHQRAQLPEHPARASQDPHQQSLQVQPARRCQLPRTVHRQICAERLEHSV